MRTSPSHDANYDERSDTVSPLAGLELHLTPQSQSTGGKTLLYANTHGSHRHASWMLFDDSPPTPELRGAAYFGRLGHAFDGAGKARAFAYSPASGHVLVLASPTARRFYLGAPATGFDVVVY